MMRNDVQYSMQWLIGLVSIFKVISMPKKDGSTVEVEITTIHPNPPTSPAKHLVKRKRRKSRSISISETCKEKRKFKGSPTAVAVVSASVANDHQEDVDQNLPSTSASTRCPTKSALVKKKKVLRKRNATNVLQKKKRINLTEL